MRRNILPVIEAGNFKHMQAAWKLRETVLGLSNLRVKQSNKNRLGNDG